MVIGETVSRYRVIELLGAGGMGEVYKAEDMRLRRTVALKFLPPALVQDREAKERLVLEAQAASVLDHPNICTIHEIDETPDGRLFLAMAYYEGETLKQRIVRGPVPLDEALDIMAQVTRGVAAAHDAAIIHRDIKPANIMLTRRAGVKLLDFGIAKLSGQTALTRTGTTVGTVAYMAPEQIMGQLVDERSDIWSLGVVFYELVAGRPPFRGEHDVAMLRAIADATPEPLRRIRHDIPEAVDTGVAKALAKEPSARYASAHDLLRDIEAMRASAATATMAAPTRLPTTARWRIVVPAVAILLIALAVAAWLVYRNTQARQARREMLAQISDLTQQEEYTAAYRLIHRAAASLGNDPELVKLRNDVLLPVTITTEPPGADLYVKGYGEPDSDWIHIGRSPLETRGPISYLRWRITKPGFETFEGAEEGFGNDLRFVLLAEGATPKGMVRIRGGNPQVIGAGAVRIPDFFIDRYEVTNREFKRFVDADGYRSREHWQQPFVKEGRELTWDQAMAEFRDATGRSGPSTWELGTFPEGQDEHPVRGVSWYEADAYARFTGKMLPTVYHWRLAAAAGTFSDILEWSNFSGKSPARVGEYRGIGPYGTFDMAGNVKEWCWNAVRDRRYILGGAWNEPNYKFRATDALVPFDRSANNGLRTMQLAANTSVPDVTRGPIERLGRDYSQEKPVSDEVFGAYQRLYAYDRGDLKSTIESVDDSSPAWRVERVSYAAAYGGERIVAYLFLPKNAAPPYQTIVYFPHGSGLALRSFEQAEMLYLGFIVKAGRALLLPMYKGTYERRLASPASGPNALRDLTIQQIKDLGRSVDYLQTRPDIDHQRLAYFGVSLGARLASIALTAEKRFRAAVVWSGGFSLNRRPPEIDEINFAPRVTTPILMLNGRDDFTFPVETSQMPMFRLLGTPEKDKRRALYDGGHAFPFTRMIKDALDWLDKYLGAPK